MPAERVIGARERNRAVVARQGLLERLERPLPRALQRVGGIQAQYAPSMYVGLGSRVAGFERDALTRALERRTVVQATLMRSARPGGATGCGSPAARGGRRDGLPTWDATFLVHDRAAGVLPEEHRPRVFSTRIPHSFGTFLVDGAVAGTWRHERGRIRLEPFGRLARAARAELGEEGERLAALHA